MPKTPYETLTRAYETFGAKPKTPKSPYAPAQIGPPKPGGAANPPNPLTGTTPGGTAPPASPLDSTYFAQLAQQQFRQQQQATGIGQQHTSALTAYQERLRQLANQEPGLVQHATETAQHQGLITSGHLGKQIGDLAANYVGAQGQAATGYQQGEQARQAALAALAQGATIDQAAAYAAAIDRRTAADQKQQALLLGLLQ